MSNARKQRCYAKANKSITMLQISENYFSNFSIPRHHKLTRIPAVNKIKIHHTLQAAFMVKGETNPVWTGQTKDNHNAVIRSIDNQEHHKLLSQYGLQGVNNKTKTMPKILYQNHSKDKHYWLTKRTMNYEDKNAHTRVLMFPQRQWITFLYHQIANCQR